MTPDNSFLHTSEKHCAVWRTQKSKVTLEDLTQFSLKEHVHNASLLSLFIVGQIHDGHGMLLQANVMLMVKLGMPRFPCLFWDRRIQKKKGFSP